MAHIEGGNCDGFTVDHYRAQRVQKRVTREALEEKNGRKGLPPPEDGAGVSTADSADGGVKLNILDDSEFPILEKGKAKDNGSSDGFQEDDLDDAASEISCATRSIKHWPTVVVERKVMLSPANRDLMAFSKLALTEKNANAASTSEDSKEIDRVEADWGERKPDNESMRKKIRKHHVIYDTTQFYNKVLGAYVCPCDRVFKTSEGMSDHLNTGIHDAGVV